MLPVRKLEILSYGACLARFELTDKVAAGKGSNMCDIPSKLFTAEKTISL
ncbi:MAG: hypothetical protein JW967_01815 [Dehalococcoidales bacterium]|nr:hypothetical protein [Dehalococcoidales bacterium]